MIRRARVNSDFLRNRSRFEKKHRKFEGAGAGMLIQVENVDCSNSRLTEIKDCKDGTFSLSLKNVILEGVSLNTYYWGTSYALSKVKCDVVVEMEADYDTDVEKLRNRLAKIKSQPKSYGIDKYSAELSFGTLSCGGGWSHMSLADGFDAEAYADELHEWRNMGDHGTVTLWWDAPNGSSVEDDMIITSIFVDAGSVLEDFYQEGEDEWLDESEDDEDDEDDAYEAVSWYRRSSESISERRRNVRNRARRNERRNVIHRGRRFNESAKLDDLPGATDTLSLALRAGDYHPYYKNRWRKLESLDPDEVFEALEIGDILVYSTTTCAHFYMVKQKTDKQIVIHEIESEFSQEGKVPPEGGSDYPAFPPKEKSQKDDFIVRADGITRWGGENRIHVQGIEHYLSVWFGLFFSLSWPF